MSNPLPVRIGRYDIVDRLGIGGMGVVYLATDPLLRRTVAVKMIQGGDDELRERFAREARSAASLRHNNIVTIYDVGEDEGRPFIAMEFVDGESMAELIRRRAPLSLHRRLEMMGELCAGLGYAHRNGIVHRDIKPANLMITTEGSLKILDFGLARMTADATSAGLTRAGALMGTPQYMAPEQIEGMPADQSSDIFSVGLVLYELIAYRRAFPGESAQAVLLAIVQRRSTPIREYVPEIDPELERVIERAVETDRDKRFPNLRALGSVLEQLRVRLGSADDGATIYRDRVRPPLPVSTPVSGTPRGDTARPGIPNLNVIAERRAAQIEQHVAAARDHFDAGRYEAAIEQCENAVVLNPDEPRALTLLQQAHRALEDRQVRAWLDEAKELVAKGALSAADGLIEKSLQLRSAQPDALALQQQVRTRRREQEVIAERRRAVRTAIERATRYMEEGAYEAAARSASEALAFDPQNEEARALKAQAATILEEQRQQREHEESAGRAVEWARQLTDAESLDEAAALLRAFQPPHPSVDRYLTVVEAAIVARDRRRQEDEERRRREEEEARQREEERRREEEARQREEERRREEESRRKREEEDRKHREEEARRKREEEARRKREEEERRKREEEERRKREEEERRKREEAERQKREEEAARKREEAEANRKRDEERARQRAEADAKRKRDDEEARQRADAEAKRKREAEEARQRAEAEARRKRDEEAARQRAEAEARRTREQEEARARAEAEAKRRREEEEARKRADETRRRAEAEARQRAAAEEERRLAAQRDAEAARVAEQQQARARDVEEQRRAAATAVSQPDVERAAALGAFSSGVAVEPSRATDVTPVWQRKPVMATAAAAVLALAVIGWLVTRESAPAAPSPAPTDAASSTPSPAPDLARTVEDARARYQRGDAAGAIAAALSIPNGTPERASADALLQEIRREAVTMAAADRRGAEMAGRTRESAFTQAAAAQQQADALTAPADTQRAVDLYQNASALYRQAASAGWNVQQFVAEATQELQARRVPRAIELALQAIEREPQNRGALSVLDTIRTAARTDTDAAARQARDAGASDANSPAFKQARSSDEAARRLTEPRQTAEAVNAFAEARAAYARAATEAAQARASSERNRQTIQTAVATAETRLKAGDLAGVATALQQIEQLDPSNARLVEMRRAMEAARTAQAGEQQRRLDVTRILGEAAKIGNDNDALQQLRSGLAKYPGNAEITDAIGRRIKTRDDRVNDLLKRAQGAPDPQALALLDEALTLDPNRSDVRAERERRGSGGARLRADTDVRNTLAAFEAAYEARNVNEFLRVAGYWTPAQVATEFKNFSSIQLQVANVQVAVDEDAAGATVSATITFVREPAGVRARPITDTRPWELRFENSGGAWRITRATRR